MYVFVIFYGRHGVVQFTQFPFTSKRRLCFGGLHIGLYTIPYVRQNNSTFGINGYHGLIFAPLVNVIRRGRVVMVCSCHLFYGGHLLKYIGTIPGSFIDVGVFTIATLFQRVGHGKGFGFSILIGIQASSLQ